MNYKHIIWDWNGTLLNDRQLCIDSINTLLAARSKPILTEKDYLEKFDFPVKDYYIKAGFDLTKENFKVPAIQFIYIYNSKRKKCSLQKNALMVLGHFHEVGISQSLLSASEQSILDDMVDHFKLDKFFPIVRGLNNHYAASKLDLAKILLKELDIPSNDVLMIGDTRHDLDVARELGVDIILYDQGHFPRHRLDGCGAPIISDLLEITSM